MLCTKMRSMIPVFLFGIFFVFLAFAVNIDNAKAANNPYPGTNANNDRHAAWQYAYDGTGVIMPYWGSVEEWLDRAKSSGRSTGTTPKKGAIVYFKGTRSSNWNHVAYVNDVKNGKIQIKEGQYYKTANTPVENVAWVDSKVNSIRFPGKHYEAKLIGYIHIYEHAANDLAGLMGDYIPDGDYQLHSAINDSYVMSVDEGLKNRSNIAIRLNKKNVQTQVFTIKRVQTSNNAYTIADKSGKFAVEVAGSNRMVGGNVQLYNYGVRGSTKFVFQKDGGYYRTKSIVSGNVMDVQGGTANDGRNIHIWAEEKIPARKWRLVPYAININQATINGVVDKVYTGSPVLQQINVSMAGKNLTQGTDYEVKYSNNVNVGTATVTVIGRGAYYGSLQKQFRITAPPTPPANKASEAAKDEKTINKTITRRASDTDVPGSSSAPLWLMQKKATKSAITIKWNKVKQATKYVIYGNKCGKKNKMKKIAVLGKNKKSWTQKKLKKGRYYKYLVVAYNGSNSVAISRTVHIATKGGKATNAGKIKVKKKIVVHKNNKYAIKAIQVRELKKGKIAKHKALMFEPLKTGIAKVSSKGVIRPLKTGKFSIRIVAQNGRFSMCTVVVKPILKKPGRVTVIKLRSNKNVIFIKWKKVKYATRYIVRIYKNGKWKIIYNGNGNKCSFNGKYSTKYKFRICAFKGRLKGKCSRIMTCRTKRKPIVIGRVKIKSIKCKGRKVTLKWKKAKNAKKYIVYVCYRGEWKRLCTTKRLRCVYKGKYLKRYIFKVCGINGEYRGRFSAEKHIKTHWIVRKNQIKISLLWGNAPEDIDSHLYGPNKGGRSHIYFANKSEGDIWLDKDDVDGWGYETTRVKKARKGIFRFFVHDYTNRGSSDSNEMSWSDATVKVYLPNGKMKTIYIPAGRYGTVWHVFNYNYRTKKFKLVNDFYYEDNPGYVGY